ncbi:Cytosine-purine permease [Mycena sanguinolenta]|uniref:Cytosine-purine permease n=1 Tax=Mycena sanguinolenta TaxID=230812 RepID=A0A8H6Y5E1_9AGAR|nr:Cytosine-purine permease [Mycena sanguinolenta]
MPDSEKEFYSEDAVSEGHDECIDTLNVFDGAHTSLWRRRPALSAALEHKVGINACGIQQVSDQGHEWEFLDLPSSQRSESESRFWGPDIFLGLGDSMLATFFVTVVTAALPAYVCVLSLFPLPPPSLGSLFGASGALLALPDRLACLPFALRALPLDSPQGDLCLRQITSPLLGSRGAKIVALRVLGGAQSTRQTLYVVVNDALSDAAGVVIIAAVTLAIDMLWLQVRHARRAATSLVNVPMGPANEASNVLSFAYAFTISRVS